MPTGTSEGRRPPCPAGPPSAPECCPSRRTPQAGEPSGRPPACGKYGDDQPHKSSSPAKLTTAAAVALAYTRHSIRTRLTRTPREAGHAVPQAQKLNPAGKGQGYRQSQQNNCAGQPQQVDVRVGKTSHGKVIVGDKNVGVQQREKEMPALSSACTAMPARITVDLEESTRPAIAIMSSVVRKAPQRPPEAGRSPRWENSLE